MRLVLGERAHAQAEQVDGEKARAVDHPGEREQRHAGRHDQQRQRAAMLGAQRQAAQDPRHRHAAEQADRGAEAGLLGEQQQRVADTGIGLDRRDEREREKDRHRVIEAGFGFERRRDARIQSRADLAQQREHRGRIGRPDDRAEQQPEPPVEMHHAHRDDTDNARGDHHADRREPRRRPKAAAKAAHSRAEPAFEQDDRERRVADPGGEQRAVETDAEGAIFADRHPGNQEHQQERQAEARRQNAGQQAREHQQPADQEQQVHRFHGGSTLAEPIRQRRGAEYAEVRRAALDVVSALRRYLLFDCGERNCPPIHSSSTRPSTGRFFTSGPQ